MELDHVEAFVAIVRRGGFTRAASTLHLSQPAIGRRVHLLERELGAPLFERLRSSAALTDAGRAFLPHAEVLLAAMRDGIDAVSETRGIGRGAVTLAVVGTLASTTLTERLRRFRDAHPGIELRLRTALSAEVSALVLRGDATLGLRYGVDPHPDLTSATVHDEPMVAVCSPRHRLARAAGEPGGAGGRAVDLVSAALRRRADRVATVGRRDNPRERRPGYSRRVPRPPGSLHLPAIAGPFVTLGLVYGVWYSYSVLLVALVKEFAWPRALAAGAFSLFVLVHGAAGPLVGRVVETLGARVVIMSGSLVLAAGLLLAAQTHAWWHLYLAFGVIAAAGTCATGWVPAVSIVRRWHPERFGTAVGIASAGTGVGIVAVVPATQLLVTALGWRWALRVLAAVILVWVLSAARWFARDPAPAIGQMRSVPDAPGVGAAGHWTLAMALRSWRFWGVGLVFLAGSTATQTLLVHQVAYLVDKGVAALVAATVVSVVGLASIAGKISWGTLADQVGSEVAFTLASLCVVSAIGVLALTSSTAPSLAYVYAVLMGVGYASSAPLPPAVVGRLFRGPHFASIFGALQPATSIGSAMGAWVAGGIFDRTGSYALALILAAIIAALAPVLLWVVAPRRPHPLPGAGQR